MYSRSSVNLQTRQKLSRAYLRCHLTQKYHHSIQHSKLKWTAHADLKDECTEFILYIYIRNVTNLLTILHALRSKWHSDYLC